MTLPSLFQINKTLEKKTIQLKFKLNRRHPFPIYKPEFRLLLDVKINEV